jgi:hypothetical protein
LCTGNGDKAFENFDGGLRSLASATWEAYAAGRKSATSHEALDRDEAFQTEVANAASALCEAVTARRQGQYPAASKGLVDPRSKNCQLSGLPAAVPHLLLIVQPHDPAARVSRQHRKSPAEERSPVGDVARAMLSRASPLVYGRATLAQSPHDPPLRRRIVAPHRSHQILMLVLDRALKLTT